MSVLTSSGVSHQDRDGQRLGENMFLFPCDVV